MNALPGLKSVASAIAAPASASARAGRHRPVEEERARGEQDAHDLARRQAPHAVVARRLEMIDRARAELDRERDRPALGELIAVQPQCEPGVAARCEIAPRLAASKAPRSRKTSAASASSRRLRQHLRECEVEVRVGVGELRRDRVRAEPGREAARSAHRSQRRELRFPVEPVARLALPGRRAVARASTRRGARPGRAAPSAPSARVERTVERIPPPAACSSS